jgi:hypothetical protein
MVREWQNRQRTMGEAKRRRKSGTKQGSNHAQRLVASWRGHGTEYLGNVFRESMATRNPDRILERAFSLLDEGEGPDFAEELYGAAGDLLTGIKLSSGVIVEGNLSLFAIPVHGTRSEIDRLARGDLFDELAWIMHEAGSRRNRNYGESTTCAQSNKRWRCSFFKSKPCIGV